MANRESVDSINDLADADLANNRAAASLIAESISACANMYDKTAEQVAGIRNEREKLRMLMAEG